MTENLAKDLHGSLEENVHEVKVKRQHTGEAATALEDVKKRKIKNKEQAWEIVDTISTQQKQFEELPIMVRRMNDDIKVLQNDNKELRNDNKKMNDEIKELRNDNESIKTRLTWLENSLHAGQIAYDFENDLAKYIYPEGTNIESSQIFTNMKKWLENEKRTKEGKESNEKWNELMNKEFKWSPKHENVFFKLVKSRIKLAHPKVDWNLARSRIPDDYTEQEKNYIIDIIAITERVNELMANA